MSQEAALRIYGLETTLHHRRRPTLEVPPKAQHGVLSAVLGSEEQALREAFDYYRRCARECYQSGDYARASGYMDDARRVRAAIRRHVNSTLRRASSGEP